MFGRQNQTMIDTSIDFKEFADIHGYFQDKYSNSIFSYDEFDSRVRHFICFLSSDDNPRLPVTAKRYRELYIRLLDTQSMKREKIIAYLRAVGSEAQSALPEKVPFYQRFLLRLALPILAYSDMSDTDFEKILNAIPKVMLMNEQAASMSERFSPTDPTNIWLHLSESPCKTAMKRFCMIVSHFPTEDSPNTDYYVARTLLQAIQSDTRFIVSTENRSVVIKVFKNLLLSVRQLDVIKTISFLSNNMSDDFSLIQDILCSSVFLILLGTPVGSDRLIRYPAEVFHFLLSSVTLDKQINGEKSSILSAFNAICLEQASDNNFLTSMLVDVSNFSSEAFALFFSILDKNIARQIYSADYLDELYTIVCRRTISTHSVIFNENISLRAIIKFVLSHLHYESKKLSKYCQNIKKEINSAGIAPRIRQYCVIKQNLYRELSECVNRINEDFPTKKNVTTSTGQMFIGRELYAQPYPTLVIPVQSGTQIRNR